MARGLECLEVLGVGDRLGGVYVTQGAFCVE